MQRANFWAHRGPYVYDGGVQVWNIETGLKLKDLESDRRDFGYAYAPPADEMAGRLSYSRDGNTSAILLRITRDWTTAGRVETAEWINDFCFSPHGAVQRGLQFAFSGSYSTPPGGGQYTAAVRVFRFGIVPLQTSVPTTRPGI